MLLLSKVIIILNRGSLNLESWRLISLLIDNAARSGFWILSQLSIFELLLVKLLRESSLFYLFVDTVQILYFHVPLGRPAVPRLVRR